MLSINISAYACTTAIYKTYYANATINKTRLVIY